MKKMIYTLPLFVSLGCGTSEQGYDLDSEIGTGWSADRQCESSDTGANKRSQCRGISTLFKAALTPTEDAVTKTLPYQLKFAGRIECAMPLNVSWAIYGARKQVAQEGPKTQFAEFVVIPYDSADFVINVQPRREDVVDAACYVRIDRQYAMPDYPSVMQYATVLQTLHAPMLQAKSEQSVEAAIPLLIKLETELTDLLDQGLAGSVRILATQQRMTFTQLRESLAQECASDPAAEPCKNAQTALNAAATSAYTDNMTSKKSLFNFISSEANRLPSDEQELRKSLQDVLLKLSPLD